MKIELVYIDKWIFDEISFCIKKFKETNDLNWLSSIPNLKLEVKGNLIIDLGERD